MDPGEFLEGFQWFYRAKVDRVVDGDTVDLLIDLGFSTLRRERIRLHGVDTPERSDRVGWKAATDYVSQMIAGREVIVETIKDTQGKYGRYLGIIHVQQGKEVINVNEKLLELGLAKRYED